MVLHLPQHVISSYTEGMATVVTPQEDGIEILIPGWIIDNASFLRWAESDEVPERGRYEYINNQLWIDQTMETVFHNLIKSEIGAALYHWAKSNGLGRYYTDGMLFSSPSVQLSCEPDGMFTSRKSQESGKVWLEKGRTSKVLYGIPDMILEVVSKSSKRKDLTVLRDLYHQVGVSEYWVVNSLEENPGLIILKHMANGYIHTESADGWVESSVFGAKFRLVFGANPDEVTLERQ
jgi:Uma2 family endonuclease